MYFIRGTVTEHGSKCFGAAVAGAARAAAAVAGAAVAGAAIRACLALFRFRCSALATY